MSAYRCYECEEFKDADFHGCNESPDDECECICDACLDNYPLLDYEYDFDQEE